VALSQLRELGEQAVAAVAASLVDGGAVLKAQLIASAFTKLCGMNWRSPRWMMPSEPRSQ
jgi:roadblock/LC7 domain-containing protein